MEIRQAVLTDVSMIVEIEKAGFTAAEAASEEVIMERIKKLFDTFLVALVNGEIAGFINGCVMAQRYITDDLYDELNENPEKGGYQNVLSLAVSPDFRGQGIGRHLLAELEKNAKKAERTGISLTCKATRVTFYGQLGYKNEGLSNSTHGGEEWFNMIKEL